ncbi:hypothetical protein V8E36_000700 [Tilletia maclaganii]
MSALGRETDHPAKATSSAPVHRSASARSATAPRRDPSRAAHNAKRTRSASVTAASTPSSPRMQTASLESVISSTARPLQCDYLENGQKGCSTYADCISGLCQSGTCKLGQDGDPCVSSKQCVSGVCSVAGKCFSPGANNTLSRGEACTNANQCLSNACYLADVTRPSILKPGGTATATDASCDPGVFGRPCRVGADCGSNYCNDQGVCAGRDIGAPCSVGGECTTLLYNHYTNTCDLSSRFAPCNGNDEQCYSKQCGTAPCYFGGDCSDTDDQCLPVPPNGKCRDSDDCAYYYNCIRDNTTDKVCKGNAWARCTQQSDCQIGSNCEKGMCTYVPFS